MMSTGDLLNIEPVELKFLCTLFFSFRGSLCVFSRVCRLMFDFVFAWSFSVSVELKKQISCSLQLSNKTDSYVAFKVIFLSLFVFSESFMFWCVWFDCDIDFSKPTFMICLTIFGSNSTLQIRIARWWSPHFQAISHPMCDFNTPLLPKIRHLECDPIVVTWY